MQPTHSGTIQVDVYYNWRTPDDTQSSDTNHHHNHHYMQSFCSAWRNSLYWLTHQIIEHNRNVKQDCHIPCSHWWKSMYRSLREVCCCSLTLTACCRDLDSIAVTKRLPRGAPHFLLACLITTACIAAECSLTIVPRLGGVICDAVGMMEGQLVEAVHILNAIVSHFLDNYWTLGRSVGLSTIVSSHSSASWCLQFIPKEDANPAQGSFEVGAFQLAQVWEGVAL